MAACMLMREESWRRRVCSAPTCGIQFHRFPDQEKAGWAIAVIEVGELGLTMGRSISKKARVLSQANSAWAVRNRATPPFCE